MDESYVTIERAMELSGLSRYVITRLIKEGQIQTRESPFDKRRLLLRKEDVERVRDDTRRVEGMRESA